MNEQQKEGALALDTDRWAFHYSVTFNPRQATVQPSWVSAICYTGIEQLLYTSSVLEIGNGNWVISLTSRGSSSNGQVKGNSTKS